MTDHETVLNTWREMAGHVREAGMVSFALVGVDAEGHVHYGADYGHDNGSALLERLAEIERDIKHSIKLGPTA